MDKKLINEDIQNMKYLLGYKPGRVISEQDIDYTTEDFSHDEIDEEEMEEGYKYDDVDETNPDDVEDDVFADFDLDELGLDDEDEDTLFEQEEPETDRYMFFSNLQQIHRQMGILLEKDPEMIHNILENGHDWAQDHIATAKESIDQVFDFIMNEEEGDGDGEEMFESHENENKETLRKQLHTLVGNEMKLGKKADMGGAAHHKEEHKKAEKELKDFLNDNPSMEKYQDEVEEHFYKQLYG
jgi:hypothetical protein